MFMYKIRCTIKIQEAARLGYHKFVFYDQVEKFDGSNDAKLWSQK